MRAAQRSAAYGERAELTSVTLIHSPASSQWSLQHILLEDRGRQETRKDEGRQAEQSDGESSSAWCVCEWTSSVKCLQSLPALLLDEDEATGPPILAARR